MYLISNALVGKANRFSHFLCIRQPVSLPLLVSGVVFAKRATKEMAFSAMETLQW